MKAWKKIVLIISLVVFCSGLAMCVVSASMINYDFRQLDTSEYATKKTEVKDNFDNINIHTVSENVTFKQSSDNVCRVEYKESDRHKVTVEVRDNTLYIDSSSDNWYLGINFFDFSFLMDEMTVYLPANNYDSLNVYTVSGDINITKTKIDFDKAVLHTTSGEINLRDSCEDLDISTTSGDVSIEDITAGKSLIIFTTSGDLKISGCTFTETQIHSTSGDIDFDKTDPGSGSISTVSGDVQGKLKGFHEIKTSTVSGDIDISDSREGEPLLDIHTTSGDIQLH